ncbi:MAG: carbon monoxide dehydrogenase subunit G [Rhizobiaceae bacterium]|nr:carbon monoxide dehydrogenase subunit G [Rhizobiaceae bacterium]
MDMTGEERIAAPRDVVWAALNDPGVLKQCIPGCQSLDWVSPTTLTAAVKVKIGPLSVSFDGEIALTNIKAPHSYTISAEGKGGLAGFAKGAADVTLKEDGNETILHYDAGTEIGGKIAQLGSWIVGSSARKLAQQFFANFVAAVTGNQAPA